MKKIAVKIATKINLMYKNIYRLVKEKRKEIALANYKKVEEEAYYLIGKKFGNITFKIIDDAFRTYLLNNQIPMSLERNLLNIKDQIKKDLENYTHNNFHQ